MSTGTVEGHGGLGSHLPRAPCCSRTSAPLFSGRRQTGKLRPAQGTLVHMGVFINYRALARRGPRQGLTARTAGLDSGVTASDPPGSASLQPGVDTAAKVHPVPLSGAAGPGPLAQEGSARAQAAPRDISPHPRPCTPSEQRHLEPQSLAWLPPTILLPDLLPRLHFHLDVLVCLEAGGPRESRGGRSGRAAGWNPRALGPRAWAEQTLPSGAGPQAQPPPSSPETFRVEVLPNSPTVEASSWSK